ncbi:serine/threonine-protein kinase [Thalassotalea sp. G20_0]|uniref:serine/threonine-protein kinase n=1 Tax=Thalassotalea sp. G20_0 TaxID=2821093 RepID=UPI001ADCDBC8|nr:serine/threonine-protein kinase [Thalassotalea sp. G20_0]MBO9494001.1 serine/threonine-protein kinase [Thalassotalea sp. G20_0]
MERFNVTSPSNINPEQINLAEPKAANYSGIKEKKDTKILNSDGKLVSKWGRRIENHFNKTFIDEEKSVPKANMYEFEKGITKRRIEVLMEEVQEDQEGKNRSDHVDSILKLPDEIPEECTFFDKNQFRKLIESDTEVYLSHEIHRCKSGASLVALKKEVNRLKAGNKLSANVIDSLNQKIHDQMAVLVKAMPGHLKSIPYDGDPEKDFNMAIKKCHAIKNLFNAAEHIDKNLAVRLEKEACEMMVNTFSSDVSEIKKLCLARNNLKESEQLSKDIKNLREETVKPFLNTVAVHPEKYCQKIQVTTEKAITELENQRKIIPDNTSNLNNKVRRSSITENTETPLLQKDGQSNVLLDLQPAEPITFQGAPIDPEYNCAIIPKKELKKTTTLGKGAFGSVVLVKHKRTKQKFALKIVGDDTARRDECAKMVRIQRAIAATGENTENIANLVSLSRGKSNKKYILMEYGGENLLDSSEKDRLFRGEDLKSAFFQATRGINTLFKAGYQHHDIKPENILINGKGVVKICDFGFSAKMDRATPVRSGTPSYISPEKLYNSTNKPNVRADSWALGCTFAEMCLGGDPIMPVTKDMWKGKTPYKEALAKLKEAREDAYQKLLEVEGEQAADFFRALTEPDPEMRLSPTEALEHPYFASYHS